jgi:alpha-methylacyl-CoA racemase
MVGLGPGAFAGMLLADMGAEVLRVARPGAGGNALGALDRGKRTTALDLKDHAGVEAVLALMDEADVFVDVFRPGVTERLGLGPDVACARNPGLIYGRLTGYGQSGPWAQRAGHDIDYLALAGALEPLGRAGGPPTPPINVLADFAGGGLTLVMGVCAALFERERSGRGQVIDAAMVDGAAQLMAPFYAGRASGAWGARGTNFLDGAAPFYDTYECADGGWLSVGAIEPQFYMAFVRGLGLDLDPEAQWDRARWPDDKRSVAERIRTRTRDDWCVVFEDLDACVAPALPPDEAPSHPHAVARAAFVRDGQGSPQPAPAPRFSRTPSRPPG